MSKFYVIATDDEGSSRLFTGYSTALGAAKAVASIFPGVDAEEFARTWNASSESGSHLFAIGQEE